jgi:hypothetical protein
MIRRPIALLLAAVLAALLAPAADAGPSSHPYFDDGGTLAWYRSYDEAKAAAAAQGKVIFVEYGRRICGSCRALCSTVLPDPRVKGRLSRTAVGLAADCDRPDPRIRDLFQRYQPRARMLPLAAFLTADGRYITGFSGHCDATGFLAHLARAETQVDVRPMRRGPSVSPPRTVPAPVRRAPVPCPPAPCPCPPERARGPACAPPAPPAPCERETPALPAPPTLAETPERATPPAPVARNTRPVDLPDASLTGSPDARVVSTPPAATETAPAPTRKLAPPRVKILPPVKVASRRTAPRRTGADPDRLVAEGRWGDVLELCAKAPSDSKLRRYQAKAHDWAGGRLDAAVASVKAGEVDPALAAIDEVLEHMAGEPEYVDAVRGLSAIKTLLELRFLEPGGDVARAVRQQTREELRGTRWAALFAD